MAYFYVTITGDFERFQYSLSLKQVFWKTTMFFKKTGVLFFTWKFYNWKCNCLLYIITEYTYGNEFQNILKIKQIALISTVTNTLLKRGASGHSWWSLVLEFTEFLELFLNIFGAWNLLEKGHFFSPFLKFILNSKFKNNFVHKDYLENLRENYFPPSTQGNNQHQPQ